MNRHERTQALAKTALALMAERDVEPSPENFQLFYAYAAGDNPAVSQTMGSMITQRQTLTPQVLEDLRDRFFSKNKLDTVVESIGEEITGTIRSVLDRIAAAERDTEDYGRKLSAASGELVGDHSPAQVAILVQSLIGATKAMEARTKSLEEELQRSSDEVEELRVKLDDVRRESLLDPLTGIRNRKAFDTELVEAIDQARKTGEPLSLFMCDIDYFKRFNDTWGHITGDQVLRLVAQCLSENVKGRDTAARYGGEEFVVILRRTPLNAAVTLANQIRTHVETKRLVKRSSGDILGRLTISIGVAQFAPNDGPADIVQRADACLYAAKNQGRNCVVGESDIPAQPTGIVAA
ncbi:MAG: GGDEF domain-containing protein [Rhizomicrobium sp.]